MRRVTLASVIQAAMATIALVLLALICVRGSVTLPDDAAGLALLALACLASGATAVLGFAARRNERLRLPFALACAAWFALYAVPVTLDLWREATAEPPVLYTEGQDPLVTMSLIIGTAASRAGGAVVRRLLEVPLVAHGVTLLLAASACISDRSGASRWNRR